MRARGSRGMGMRDDVEALQDELARTRRELEFVREELKVLRPQQTLSSQHTSMRRQQTRKHPDLMPIVDCFEGEHPDVFGTRS